MLARKQRNQRFANYYDNLMGLPAKSSHFAKSSSPTKLSSAETKLTPYDVNDAPTKPASVATKLTPEEQSKKKKKWRSLSLIPPVIAAIGKSLKDGFGAMTLYSLLSFGSLKLTAGLLNPWIGAVVFFLAISLFFISLGMEGKSLRERILTYLSKRNGFDMTQDDKHTSPVKGWINRVGMHLAIFSSQCLRLLAPWTAAICKGISGMGSTAGCLLLILAGMGVITSTAIVSATGAPLLIPAIILALSVVVGVTLALVSRYKEGDDFINVAKSFELHCWQRLHCDQGKGLDKQNTDNIVVEEKSPLHGLTQNPQHYFPLANASPTRRLAHQSYDRSTLHGGSAKKRLNYYTYEPNFVPSMDITPSKANNISTTQDKTIYPPALPVAPSLVAPLPTSPIQSPRTPLVKQANKSLAGDKPTGLNGKLIPQQLFADTLAADIAHKAHMSSYLKSQVSMMPALAPMQITV